MLAYQAGVKVEWKNDKIYKHHCPEVRDIHRTFDMLSIVDENVVLRYKPSRITERLLSGRKESNQTNKTKDIQ